MSKTYRAEFFTRADWAFWNFAAKTPKEALRLARRFYDERLTDLDFQSYGDGDELERIQIWAGERGVLAAWESEDYHLRLAAGDLLAALEQAVTALNTAPMFAVPGLDTDSYRVAAICDRAIAKAKRG